MQPRSTTSAQAIPPRKGAHARYALVAVLLLAGTASAQTRSVEPLPSLAPLIDRVSPAVVNISVRGTITSDNPLADDPLFRRFFEFDVPRERPFQSAGSGVIIDAARGFLVTNHHVIENADDIEITLFDNRTMPAAVVGSDEASDLAVLRIDVGSNHLSQLEFAETDDLRVGDYVVAIGNPFGFANTVTAGIVSGLGRRVNPLNPDIYEDFIQTDASINPGNSGGALVNLRGELVGINSAIISRGGGNIGIGFAIPVEMAHTVMQQLIEFGEVRRGLLGVQIIPVTQDIADENDLENLHGALITAVNAGSAAQEAGLEIDDIIVSVDGEEVTDSNDLRNLISLTPPGQSVEVGYIRDGRRYTVTAVLGALKAGATGDLPDLDPAFDGVELIPGRAENGVEGLLVVRVDPSSVAADKGLRDDDVITFINRQRVRSLADAREVTVGARAIVVQVQRGSRAQLIPLR